MHIYTPLQKNLHNKDLYLGGKNPDYKQKVVISLISPG